MSDYSNGIIYPGMSYEIHVPIYNASFLPSDGKKSLTVPMKLYYRKAGSNDSGTLIGEPVETTNIIGGWTKGTENNDIDAISRDITARNIYGSGGSSCNTSGTCGIILLVLAGVFMRRR